jgi:DNA-binding response OmpR family regulator
VQVILNNGQHLLAMIDKILDYSRAKVGKIRLQLEPLDLPRFLSERVNEHQHQASPQGNRLSLAYYGDVPRGVLLDEQRLRQVLDNLLTNANRYCQKADICLSCRVLSEQEGQVLLRFAVTDSGPGIAQDDLETIFLPFHRLQPLNTHAKDGVGIGLSIARELVGLMRSELCVTSELGKGSEFYFDILCRLVSLNSTTPIQRYAPTAYVVLLVEDNVDHAQWIRDTLILKGFKVILAHSATDARAYLNASVDLVITDQQMSQGDGYQVLREWHNYAPVILMSATHVQRPLSSREPQFADILLKPVSLSALFDSIAHVLAFEWVLQQPASLTASSEQASVIPDAETLAKLHEWVRLGAVTQLKNWVLDPVSREVYPDFCAALELAVQQLDLAKLHQLTEKKA